jgi:hypothetical protein
MSFSLPIAEAAYIAGLVDGEGCLTIILQPRRAHGPTLINPNLALVIANTYKAALIWTQQRIPHSRIHQAKDARRKTPCWRLVLENNEILLTLLQHIRPYLHIKHAQADLAITYLQSRRQTRQAQPARLLGYTPEELVLLFQLRLLNQKASKTHFIYKKKHYTLKQFTALVLHNRNGSLYHVVAWTPEMDALLGTDSDHAIATRLGLKLAAVQRRRFALRIRPCKATRLKEEQYI